MTDRYDELYRSWRWGVPARLNIAEVCCGRWAADRSRFALYWEDESGETAKYTFWDLQREPNRLSNALAALGVKRGDRVALILPQRPEMAVAYMAIFQMGAIALPLSHLFGPDALEYRMEFAGASVAFVESTTIANLWAVKDKLTSLKHVIGVGGARETGVHSYESLVQKANSEFEKTDTSANDPALIIYTSGTTGAPKGALEAHRLLIGNLSGFVYSHDFFPQPGDIFWSPADWAWAGGLFDALLPTWSFGLPILGYRGKFDAEKAYTLIEKYGIRNSFLFPTALKLMMKAVPEPGKKYRLNLRSIMSAGEAVGATVIEWAREQLGVTINEMFGQTEINYVVGNCQAAWPVKPGSIGRPYPGHRVAVIDEQGRERPRGELGEIAVHRSCNGEADPGPRNSGREADAGLEDPLLLLDRDPDAGVRDGDPDRALPHARADHDLTARRRVGDRVRHEVVEGLAKPERVGIYPWQVGGDRRPHRCAAEHRSSDGLTGEPADVDLLEPDRPHCCIPDDPLDTPACRERQPGELALRALVEISAGERFGNCRQRSNRAPHLVHEECEAIAVAPSAHARSAMRASAHSAVSASSGSSP